MISIRDVRVNTPSPGLSWRQLSDADRLTLIVDTLRNGTAASSGVINVVAAKQDGQIIVTLRESMPANKRGPLLLDFEASLKEVIDPGLVVWLEPLGDRNSLRNLRGIEVKA